MVSEQLSNITYLVLTLLLLRTQTTVKVLSMYHASLLCLTHTQYSDGVGLEQQRLFGVVFGLQQHRTRTVLPPDAKGLRQNHAPKVRT